MRIDSYEKFLTQFPLYDAEQVMNSIRCYNSWAVFASEVGEPDEHNWWQWREFLRFKYEVYTKITDVLPEHQNVLDSHPHLASHFLHVAESNPMLVAYTEDEDKGRRDIQTVTKLGRYLTRYAPGFNASYYSNQYLLHQCPPTLKFATTRDEIRRVYQNGPHSCMVNTYRYDKNYDKVYAVEVYAGPDTAVAYIGDYHIQDGVKARSVVNQRDQQWIRCYGNDQVLRTLLEQAGYYAGSLEGCRVLRFIDSDNEPIMPYLDGVQRADDNGDYMLITEEGYYDCNKTDGTVERHDGDWCCDDCNETYDDEDEGTIVDGQCVCQSCLNDNYTWAYTDRHTQEYIHNDSEGIYEYNGDYYTSYALDCNNLVVLEDGEVYSQDDIVEDYLDSDQYIPIDDAVKVADSDGEGMTLLSNLNPDYYNLSFDLHNEVVHLDRDYEDVISEELTTLEELISLFPQADNYSWQYASTNPSFTREFRKVIRHIIGAAVANQTASARLRNSIYLNTINQPTYAAAA